MSDSNQEINSHLFNAIRQNNIDEVKRLISEGADVNVLDGNRLTPLWHAIVKGNKDIVSLLIDNKADVNAQSETGRALLHVAVDKANKTQTHDTSIIKILLEAEGINVNIANKEGRTPLHEAAKSYDKKIVTVLLEAKGIYVTPLDNTSSTPLNLAFQQGRKHIVKILEETQKDIEALYSAVKSDNYEEIQNLLSKGVNVNPIDSNGKTPLHFAATNGHVKVMQALLDKGVNVNAKSNNGQTPLHLAVLWNKIDIVEALLEAKGINVNTKNNDGQTPLHLAAQNNNKEIVEALIKAKANVNIKDEDGNTPLGLTTNEEIKTLLQPTEKSDPVDESSTDSKGGKEEEKQEGDAQPGSDITGQNSDNTEPQSDNNKKEEEKTNTISAKKGTDIKAKGVKDDSEYPSSTEPAQTEEQPSSFFGSLFSILMKPFSLIASFFGGFFSWLFGSDTDESTSQTDASVSLLKPSLLEEKTDKPIPQPGADIPLPKSNSLDKENNDNNNYDVMNNE